MSVIGRLDDQVNEKLIKPVGARNRPEKEPVPPAEQRGAPVQSTDLEESTPGKEGQQKSGPQSDLPVWLL